MRAKPPTSSLASVKGPSVTLKFPPVRRTRAPSALGRQPSVARRMPDLKDSSISLPIWVISPSLGGVPSGLSDLKRHRKRMLFLLDFFLGIFWELVSVRLLAGLKGRSVDMSNGVGRNRQGPDLFFDYFFAAIWLRRRSSRSLSSGVRLAPKSSASKTGRISTSAPGPKGLRLSHSTASSMLRTCQI